MLVPRFSISRMLGFMTVSSLFFAVVALAARGSAVASAVVTAFLMIGLSLVIFSIVHSLSRRCCQDYRCICAARQTRFSVRPGCSPSSIRVTGR